MKQAMINYIQNEKNDELYTPIEAIKPLLKFIPKDYIIWECTDFGKSEISNELRKNGNKVISTYSKFDFLKREIKGTYHYIITNPPYSLKNEFIKRCYQLGKPFCLLLPITALEGKARGEMFREHGIQVLVLDRRINYHKMKKNIWFNTSWFCYKVLPKDLIFAQVKK